MDRTTRYVLLVILAAALFGAGVLYGRYMVGASAPLQALPAAVEQKAAAQEQVAVHMAGAVERPGVYRLQAGSRLDDAVRLAGPLPEADLQSLNLAAVLRDGQRFQVPRQGESPAAAPAGSPAEKPPGQASGGQPVNINSATLAELDTLPGIGPALGQRIIDYRESHGPFRVVDDLLNVSGIGETRLEQLRPLVSAD